MDLASTTWTWPSRAPTSQSVLRTVVKDPEALLQSGTSISLKITSRYMTCRSSTSATAADSAW
eukprot:5543150-Pyramimonas_sp.AAC.1